MASVNQTRQQCINQMGKTRSKPLAARHGRRTAWERHAMCELALSLTELVGEVFPCTPIRTKIWSMNKSTSLYTVLHMHTKYTLTPIILLIIFYKNAKQIRRFGVHKSVLRNIFLQYNQQDAPVSQIIYSCKTLFMFRTVFPSIIRSSKLHIQQQACVIQLLLPAASSR